MTVDKFAWMKALGCTKDLTVAQLRAAIAVWNSSDPDGTRAYVSAASISRDTGLNVRTAERALQALRTRGIVTRVARGGGSRASEYALRQPGYPTPASGIDDANRTQESGIEEGNRTPASGMESENRTQESGRPPVHEYGIAPKPYSQTGPPEKNSSYVGIREAADDGRFADGTTYPPDPTETAPSGDPVVTDAIRTMVRLAVGSLDRPTIETLARHAARALADQVPQPAIEKALRSWLKKPDARTAGLLPYLIAEEAKKLSASAVHAAEVAADPAASRVALAEQARQIVETARHAGDISRLEPLWLASDDPEAVAGHGFEFNPDWGTPEDQQRREWILDRFDRLARLVHADLQRRAAA